MKIFISWSGEDSKQIALQLKVWLKKLLQATEPWMSDEDIQPGTRWSERISLELRASDFGIICVTPQNRTSEWIHFEAGALSMAMKDTERKVVPLLIGFEERGDLQRSPLGLFNAVRFVEEDMWKLVLTLNAELEDSLDGTYLRELFDYYWPKFVVEVEALRDAAGAPKPPKKSPAEMTEQILETVLDIQHRQQLQSASMGTPTWALSENDLSKLLDKPERPEAKLLTTREREIVKLIQEGMSNRDIAKLLNLSIRTIEGHLFRIFSKMGVTDRTGLEGIDPYQDYLVFRASHLETE